MLDTPISQDPGTLPGSLTSPTHVARFIFFGAASRPLFGWYHPGVASRARATAVVLCPPMGYEYMSTHRWVRLLAERLADAGFPVLRFDYEGTGDSCDAAGERGRVSGWISDIGVAVEEARTRSGCRGVSLVGLRLGGTLALAAAAELGGVDDLVLWCSCQSGRAYVREARMLAASLALAERDQPASATTGFESEGGIDAAGFSLSAETARELSVLPTGAPTRAPARRALLIERDDLRVDERLGAELCAVGVAVERRSMPGFAGMMARPLNSVTPDAMLDAIVGWLGDGHAVNRTNNVSRAPGAISRDTLIEIDGVRIREKPVRFGTRQHLFGLITAPARTPAAGSHGPRPAVVMLNTALDHHVGPHRLFVPLARAWAARGFTVLRFDMGGLGDSDPSALGAESNVYPATAMADVASALEFLRAEYGIGQSVLLGMCSGAYHTVQAVRDGLAVVRGMAINPPLYFKPGDAVDMDRSWRESEMRRVRRAIFAGRTWGKVLHGRIDLRYNVKLVTQYLANRIHRRALTAVNVLGGAPRDDGPRLFHPDREMYLVFSTGDPGLEYLETNAGTELAGHRERGSIKLDVVDGPDHTFMARPWRQKLSALLTQDLLSRFG
ncbi:MAG: alpha/beta hydrolase [Gemmatimonadota bacterium]|nr:alpha/beta hydrolase [Gemmatimonadota bacterium]